MSKPVTRSVNAYHAPKPYGSYVDRIANVDLPFYSRFKTDALERFVEKVTAPSIWRTKTGKPRKELATTTIAKDGSMVEFVAVMGLLEAQLRGLVCWDPEKSKWRLLEKK